VTKVCPRCGEEKELTAENWKKKSQNKSGLDTSRCKCCLREYRQSEKCREYQRSEKQREYRREHQREYRQSEKYREYERERSRKNVKNLTDGYVKGQLRHTGFSPDQITHELIELKRQQIQATRILKKLKSWREENESINSDV